MNTSPSQRQIVYAEDAFHAADAAYGQLPAGWRERADTFGAQELKNANAHHFESPDGTQFLAFRGTKVTSMSDLWNDVKQPFGGASKYAAAAELGRQVRDQNLDVAFAGHSLGGGLAKVAAEAASTPKTPGVESRSYIAVSFNGSPVGPATYLSQGLTAQDHLRTTYHVLTSSDILNHWVKGGKLRDAGIIAERETAGSRVLVLQTSESVGLAGHKREAFKSQPLDLED